MMMMRAGEIIRHHSGKAWGHQNFSVFLKGEPDPYYGKKSLSSEGDGFRQGHLFWGTVTFVPPKKVGPDETLKAFFRVNDVAGSVHVDDFKRSSFRHAVGIF